MQLYSFPGSTGELFEPLVRNLPERIKAVKYNANLKTIDTLHFILQLEPKRSSEILVEFMDSVLAGTKIL